MANEISVSASLAASKGGADVSTSQSLSIDMNGEDMIDGTQVVGTSAELLNLGDITAPPAYVQVKNLDASNFILLSADANFTANVSAFAKLLPGGIALFPPACNVYARADTSPVRIACTAVEG